MAEQDEGDQRAPAPDEAGGAGASDAPGRPRWQVRLGLALVVGPGLGGLAWFVLDQYVAATARFTAYPLLLAGGGLVGGAWLIFGERARTAGVVCGGLLATVAALYPTIAHQPDPVEDSAAHAPSTTATSASATTTTTSAHPSTTATTVPPATATTEPPTTAPPSPRCPRLSQVGAVEASAAAGQPHVGQVTYTIDGSTNPDIEIAGRLAGTPPTGEGLYVVKTGIQGTVDSTPAHNPASVGFFMHPEVMVGSDGCWRSPPHRLGYDCVAGVGFRFSFALIPRTVGQELIAQAEANGDMGLSERSILDNSDVDVIGSLEVVAPPQGDCPG